MMEIRSGSALGNSKHGANLSVCKTFQVVQYNHRSLTVGQLRQRLIQAAPQLVRLTRIPKGHGNRVRQFIRIANFPPPHQIERRIGHDAVQPRAERLIGKKTIQCLEGVKKSFLDRILRVLVREHDRAAHGVRPTLMLTDERSKSLALPALRGDYKRSFFRSGVTR
jgi:hypothetical protein